MRTTGRESNFVVALPDILKTDSSGCRWVKVLVFAPGDVC